MLYLFSSNAQPQYAQEILNALAAPDGYKMTFRYDSKYVESRAKESWGGLAGQDVLIHFVLQQPNHYFTPVLFPIRLGKVVTTRREGGIHLVDFTVDRFVSLRDPEDQDGYPDRTTEYRRLLEVNGLPLPYESYAILADFDVLGNRDAAGLFCSDSALEVPVVFRTATQYLVRTETFVDARFAYVSCLRRQGNDKPETIDATTRGYKLTAGHEYELEFLQSQPGLVGSTSLMKVVLDGKVLQAIGPSELSIGSPYDVQTIRISAQPTSSIQYTTVGLRPGDGGHGPVLDIPIEVRPPVAKNVAVATGTAAGLVLLGLSSIFTSLGGWSKFGLVAGGALIASFLNTFRLSTKAL